MSRIFNAVTGPSGAGKSAFCKLQPDWEHHLYNLDDWARRQGEVDDPDVRESAWDALLERLASVMHKRCSPITLDHVFEVRAIDEVVRPAKALGYQVWLWVNCPGDPQICVERVQMRKTEGGHGRSEGTIRELYQSALHTASEISIECEETRLIGSRHAGFQTIGSIRNFRSNIEVQHTPTWVRQHFPSVGD